MSTIFRILIGIGLFAFGYRIGREVGRMEPIREELSRVRRRRGVTIDAQKAEPVAADRDD